jgi:hypothetical protein
VRLFLQIIVGGALGLAVAIALSPLVWLLIAEIHAAVRSPSGDWQPPLDRIWGPAAGFVPSGATWPLLGEDATAAYLLGYFGGTALAVLVFFIPLLVVEWPWWKDGGDDGGPVP